MAMAMAVGVRMAMAVGVRVVVAISIVEIEIVAPLAFPRRGFIRLGLFSAANNNKRAHLLLRLLSAGRTRKELKDLAHRHPLLEGGATLWAAILVQGHSISPGCKRF